MRLAPLLLTAAVAMFAVAAPARQGRTGLADLGNTVNGLQDAPPPAQAPAIAQPEAQPLAETPAPTSSPAATPTPAPRPVHMLTGPPMPLSRAEVGELDASVQRGRLLGLIDRSGRFATQDMLSRISDPAAAGITGWIAEQEGNGVAVIFYADTPTGPVAVYRVTILGGRIVARDVHLASARPPLNPIEVRMAAARAATAALPQRPCAGDDFNVFVIPPTVANGPVDVYQISPQTQRGHYPLGGHYKTSVGADGSVVASRGYSDACLDATVAEPVAGTAPAPIAITHVPDPLPQEIHVFLSIWTGHPLIVTAGDPPRRFAVTPDRIDVAPR